MSAQNKEIDPPLLPVVSPEALKALVDRNFPEGTAAKSTYSNNEAYSGVRFWEEDGTGKKVNLILQAAQEAGWPADYVLQLQYLNFQGSDFSGLTFPEGVGIDFRCSDFTKANMQGAQFLSKADPERTFVFVAANFSDADLREAGFVRANMLNANFNKARCEQTDFSEACLGRADFKEADVRHARFEKSELGLANFEGARVDRASFKGATYEKLYRGANGEYFWMDDTDGRHVANFSNVVGELNLDGSEVRPEEVALSDDIPTLNALLVDREGRVSQVPFQVLEKPYIDAQFEVTYEDGPSSPASPPQLQSGTPQPATPPDKGRGEKGGTGHGQ